MESECVGSMEKGERQVYMEMGIEVRGSGLSDSGFQHRLGARDGEGIKITVVD